MTIAHLLHTPILRPLVHCSHGHAPRASCCREFWAGMTLWAWMLVPLGVAYARWRACRCDGHLRLPGAGLVARARSFVHPPGRGPHGADQPADGVRAGVAGPGGAVVALAAWMCRVRGCCGGTPGVVRFGWLLGVCVPSPYWAVSPPGRGTAESGILLPALLELPHCGTEPHWPSSPSAFGT